MKIILEHIIIEGKIRKSFFSPELHLVNICGCNGPSELILTVGEV
jgi:hypothetical protein